MSSTVQAVYRSAGPLRKSEHFHDCHQMILITGGQAEFLVNGMPLAAKAGDIAVFSRYENHSLGVCSGDYERYILQLDPEVVNQKSAVYALLTDRPQGFSNVICLGTAMEPVHGIFRQLMAEHGSGAPLWEELERLLVRQLLILVHRCVSVPFDSLHDEMVIALKRQFESRYAEPCTLEALAAQFHISPSALSHRFRAATGTSVMHYLQSIRIASAKRMLAETALSINQIVEACGFSDASNFTRTFRQRTGVTPTAFRSQYAAL